MAIDFPSNPTNGQVYGNWIYDSSITAWRNVNTDTGIGALNAMGLKNVVPTSLTVSSGSATVNANGTVTVSGVTAIGLNSVFSNTYKSYKVLFNWGNTSVADDNMMMSLRSGTTNSTTQHSYSANLATAANTSSVSSTNNNSFWHIGLTSSTGAIPRYATFSCDITGPMDSTAYTSMTGQAISASSAVNGWETRNIGAHHDVQAAYDGLYIWTGSARTFSGTIQVFGYTN